jgi:hypothetical protein
MSGEASARSLGWVVALMIGSALGVTLMTAPVTRLLGAGAGAVPAAFHGLAAFLYLFVGTIGLYLGWRLLTGRISAFADLQLLAVVMATLSFVAIVEFKNLAALFTLPLTVCAAFILWRYGRQVMEQRWLRYTVAVLIGLSFFYLVVAFGLGAALTRLRPA